MGEAASPLTFHLRNSPRTARSSLNPIVLPFYLHSRWFLYLQWHLESKRPSLASVKSEPLPMLEFYMSKSHANCHLLCFRIADGAYYEAHQQLRVIAARHIKQARYDAAAELLAAGAVALLTAGDQQGAAASGGDLAIMMVLEVYNKAEWEIKGGNDDTEGRARKSELKLCNCKSCIELGLLTSGLVLQSG